MITDARALRPEYIPRDMIHRKGAIDHFSAVLDPHISAENISIFGPSGSGKTTLAKYVLRQLEAEMLDFRWGYVNCISDSCKTGALHQIVRSTGLGHDIRRAGTPATDYLNRIRQCDDYVAAVIDEVDVLDEPELIASLADIRKLSLITICVDQDELLTDLIEQGRIRTRLRSAETIQLDRYSYNELYDIIEYRVDHGLDSSRVCDEAIAAIADAAAGNARLGIAFLRRAAKHVEGGHASELTDSVVEEVADDAREDIRSNRKRYLGTHQQVLYEIIQDAGSDGVAAGELHARYERGVQEPKTRRTRRRYLDSLERYDLIESKGSTRSRRYVPIS